jgi:hypothetical protein
MTAASKL